MAIINQNYEHLFKIDNKGKTRVYYIKRESSLIRIFTGIYGNEKQTAEVLVKMGTNIGKANETTPIEQAHRETEARYTKKLSSGYYKSLTEAIEKDKSGGDFFLPMLAYELSKFYNKKGDRSKHLKDPKDYIFDPKLDGMRMSTRMNISMDGLEYKSRRGKDIPAAAFIADIIKPILAKHLPSITLDGELYNHDLKDDFENLMSLCRKQNPTEDQYKEIKDKVQYHIYDIYDSDNPDMTALERKTVIINTIMPLFNYGIDGAVRFVTPQGLPSELDGKSWDEVSKYMHDYYVTGLGYEGVIARRKDSVYENKRTYNLMKIKLFFDEEFIILDINKEYNKDREPMASSVVIKTAEGVLCKASLNGSEENAKHVWENKDRYIGRDVTVKHFGYTKYGSLRHPNVKDINRWAHE